MKRYASVFFLFACFMTIFSCHGKSYIGVIAGGAATGDFSLKKSKIEAASGYYLGGYFGYKFCPLLRLEEEITYQQSRIHSVNKRKILQHSSKGNFDIWSMMTNILIELNCPFFISPYIGGGLGYGRATADSKGFLEDKHLVKMRNRKNEFVWQLIGGLKFLSCCGIEAGLEYRYFKIGTDRANNRLGLTLLKSF